MSKKPNDSRLNAAKSAFIRYDLEEQHPLPTGVSRIEFQLSGEKVEAMEPMLPIPLVWIVAGTGNAPDFCVDLRALLPVGEANPGGIPLVSVVDAVNKLRRPGDDKPFKYSHLAVIVALAAKLRAVTSGRRQRSVQEEALKFKWFVHYLDARVELTRTSDVVSIEFSPSDLTDETVGRDFADWLRLQEGLGVLRMAAIFTTARAWVSLIAAKCHWNPAFRSDGRSGDWDDDGEDKSVYTLAQQRALVRMATDVVKSFMQIRRDSLRTYREVNRRDTTRTRVAYQAANEERKAYQLRNAIDKVKNSFNHGAAPKVTFEWTSTCIVPTAEFVAAIFLLVLMRVGGENEQAVLEVTPSASLRAGPWLKHNPFARDSGTVFLFKNRTGHEGVKKRTRLPLAFLKKPSLYPIKLLRYMELIGTLPRKWAALAAAHSPSPAARASAKRAVEQMWIYWGEGKFRYLRGNVTHQAINRLIENHASRYPELLGLDGKPIKYGSKKFRNEFTRYLLNPESGGGDVNTAQLFMHHAPRSKTIRKYLEKEWARNYARGETRKWHSACVAVVESDELGLTPALIRQAMSADGRSKLENTKSDGEKVRFGIECSSRANPPKEVYRIKNENDRCPARHCDSCQNGRIFTSGTVELAVEIIQFRRQREGIPLPNWEGSSSEMKLANLEDLMSRFPKKIQSQAYEKASELYIPDLNYRVIT